MKNPIIYILVITAFFSCKQEDRKISPTKAKPEKVVILDSLLHPWSIEFFTETDVLITEKDGNLIRANLETNEKKVITGFPNDLVDSIRVKDFRDNSGIFEVIKHPEFVSNNLVYVSYAAENETGYTTKIIRGKLQTDALTDVQTIFLADPYRFDLFHYGGGMTFGADGKLYFTIGERYYNETDQPKLPIAQDLKDKRGKIHRINDDGSIPNDNPKFGNEAIPSIYAIGIRAAQGITLNRKTGDIWFSEHGSVQGDELNILKPGANYGWPVKTSGEYRNKDYRPPKMDNETFTDPVHYWLQTIAPTGLTFYTGKEFPHWNGDIILSGLSRGSLWRIQLDDDEVISVEELFLHDRVRSRKVAMSPNGKLYMLTDEKNGKLIEIKNAATIR